MAVERISDVLAALAPLVEGNWPKQGEWTYDDYKRLPDDGWRYEVIEGEWNVMGNGRRSWLVFREVQRKSKGRAPACLLSHLYQVVRPRHQRFISASPRNSQ